MAGVAFGGVNGGSSCATLNSVGPVSQTHSLGGLDGLGWLVGGLGISDFLFSSPICFWSGSWILP